MVSRVFIITEKRLLKWLLANIEFSEIQVKYICIHMLNIYVNIYVYMYHVIHQRVTQDFGHSNEKKYTFYSEKYVVISESEIGTERCIPVIMIKNDLSFFT